MTLINRRRFLQISVSALTVTIASKIGGWQLNESLVQAEGDGYGFGSYGEGDYPELMNIFLPIITSEEK